MPKFKKNHLELLKVLQNLVDENVDFTSINPDIEEDAADFFIEITDRKRMRRLKSIKKEVDKWIVEMTEEKKNENSLIKSTSTS